MGCKGTNKRVKCQVLYFLTSKTCSFIEANQLFVSVFELNSSVFQEEIWLMVHD